MNIGLALKRIRIEKGMKQMDVSKKSKISQTYLSLLEKGHKKNPSAYVIKKLCKVYSIPPSIVVFMGTEESDILPSKRQMFKQLKQPIDSLILEFLK